MKILPPHPLLLAVLVALSLSSGMARSGPPPEQSTDTAGDLQNLVFGLADRYVQGYAELLTDLGDDEKIAPGQRLAAQLEKVHTASAIYSLATGPNPEATLLDLMVLSHLRRLQLEGGGAERRFGVSSATAGRLLAFSRTVETEIWSAGEKYVTPGQAAELRQLDETWHRENADLDYSSLVHFHGFFAAHSTGRLADVMRGSRGMLGPLRDAVARIDEARLVSERAMFLSVRLPLLARWQVEALGYHMLTLPESRALLAATTTLSASTESLARDMNALPATITREREALLSSAGGICAQLSTLVADSRAAIADASSALDRAEKISASLRATSEDARATLSIMENIQRTHTASPLGATTPEQFLAIVNNARAGAEAVRQTAQIVQRLAGPDGDGTPAPATALLTETEAALRRTIDHAAWRAAELVAGALLLWAIMRWRLTPRPGAPA